MNTNSKACCVYWLYDAGCSTPEVSGYVGITCQLPRRLRGHTRSKRFPQFRVKILFEGTRNECSALEFNLRPDVGIGWNLGTGGRSTLCKEQRDALSNRMKGKRLRLGAKLTERQKANISAGRKGKALGNKNNCKWLVTADRNVDGTWKLERKE